MIMRKKIVGPLLAASVLALTVSGCTTTERNVATGAGAGALAGAAIGSFSANAGWGALAGAGVGALGGYLYSHRNSY
jgi:hypothetical protein